MSAIDRFLRDLPDAVASVRENRKPTRDFLGAAAELIAASLLGLKLVSDWVDGHDAEHGDEWIEIRSSTNDQRPKTGADKDHIVFCWVRFKIDSTHLWLEGISTQPRGSGLRTQHMEGARRTVL